MGRNRAHATVTGLVIATARDRPQVAAHASHHVPRRRLQPGRPAPHEPGRLMPPGWSQPLGSWAAAAIWRLPKSPSRPIASRMAPLPPTISACRMPYDAQPVAMPCQPIMSEPGAYCGAVAEPRCPPPGFAQFALRRQRACGCLPVHGRACWKLALYRAQLLLARHAPSAPTWLLVALSLVCSGLARRRVAAGRVPSLAVSVPPGSRWIATGLVSAGWLPVPPLEILGRVPSLYPAAVAIRRRCRCAPDGLPPAPCRPKFDHGG